MCIYRHISISAQSTRLANFVICGNGPLDWGGAIVGGTTLSVSFFSPSFVPQLFNGRNDLSTGTRFASWNVPKDRQKPLPALLPGRLVQAGDGLGLADRPC